MRVFILQRDFGLAVVIAKDPDDALEQLKKYEGDSYLSHGVTADDFKEVTSDGSEEVIGFYAD